MLFHIRAVTSVYFSTCEGVWGLSRVPSSKSRLLKCLIQNKELLCTKFSGIRPHFSLRGKSHGFSRVAAGTWGIFAS